MTPCVASLASVDKRVSELGHIFSRLAKPAINSNISFLGRIYFVIWRAPYTLLLFYHALLVERDMKREDRNFRELLQNCSCPPDVLHDCWERCIPMLRGWEKVLDHAYKAGFPGYILTRLENCLHMATDLAEDLEIAADPECRSLFDKLAVELAKRQK